VRQTFRRDYYENSVFVTVAGETIESTRLHPYWVVRGEELDKRPRRNHLAKVTEGATTAGRWVDAGDLRIGDQLLLRDGRILPVEAVRQQPHEGAVFNFLVGGLNCYAVGYNGVLVHNGNGDADNGGPGDGMTDPDTIAEEMGPGHFRDHGDPADWTPVGKVSVPATGAGFEPGTQKVYEGYLDENGQQIEWHYWIKPDGTVEGGKVVFPGTTDFTK
jgi:hypothetical protein